MLVHIYAFIFRIPLLKYFVVNDLFTINMPLNNFCFSSTLKSSDKLSATFPHRFSPHNSAYCFAIPSHVSISFLKVALVSLINTVSVF